MRIERVGLEHHRQAALGRRCFGHIDIVDEDATAGLVFQSGDETQQGGFAAARRADEDDEGAMFHREIDAGNHDSVAKRLANAFENDLAHDGSYFTAPNVRPRTSCFWLNQPRTRMGATARVEAAESLAQNNPSGLE